MYPFPRTDNDASTVNASLSQTPQRVASLHKREVYGCSSNDSRMLLHTLKRYINMLHVSECYRQWKRRKLKRK